MSRDHGSYVSKHKPRRDLRRTRRLSLAALAEKWAEHLGSTHFDQVKGIVVGHVEEFQRGFETVLSDLNVPAESDIQNVQRWQRELPLIPRRVAKPDRGRERIRHRPAVGESHGRRTKPKIRRGQARDDGAGPE